MVRWSRDRRYLAAVTKCIWTRTRHMPYFPRLLFHPLWDYFKIPLWVEELCKHSRLLGLLLLKCEQGVSSQWSPCHVLAMASVGVCTRAEWGQLPSNLKEEPERRLGTRLKYTTAEFTALQHKKCQLKTFCTFMMLHYTISHLSWYSWNLLILAQLFYALCRQAPPPKRKTGCATHGNIVHRMRTTNHLLCCAGTFLG